MGRHDVTVKFTIVDADNVNMCKKFERVDGQIVSTALANMYSGVAHRVGVHNLKDYCEVVHGLKPNQCIIPGVVVGDVEVQKLVTNSREHELSSLGYGQEEGIGRNNVNFEFAHEPGLFMVDIDCDSKNRHNVFTSVDDALDKFEAVFPAVRCVDRVAYPSSSSYIVGYKSRNPNRDDLAELRGVRIVFMVSNAALIPDLAKDIEGHEWRLRRGYIKVSKSGALLVRSLIDHMVYQPNRIFFEASPLLGDGVERALPAVRFRYRRGEWDTRIPYSSVDEERQYVAEKELRAKAKTRNSSGSDIVDSDGLFDIGAYLQSSEAMTPTMQRAVDALKKEAKLKMRLVRSDAIDAYVAKSGERLGYDKVKINRLRSAVLRLNQDQILPSYWELVYFPNTPGHAPVLCTVADVARNPSAFEQGSFACPLDSMLMGTVAVRAKAVLSFDSGKAQGLFSYKTQQLMRFPAMTSDGEFLDAATLDMATTSEAFACGMESEKEILDLPLMLERFVMMPGGEGRVYDLASGKDFPITYVRNACRHCVDRNLEAPGTANKAVSYFDLWLADPRQRLVYGSLFAPGTRSPIVLDKVESLPHLNLWRDPHRKIEPTPTQVEYAGSLFTELVDHLFRTPEVNDCFKKFIAHLQQKPTELPNWAFVHIAKEGGHGRGTLIEMIKKMVGLGHYYEYRKIEDIADRFNAGRATSLFNFVNEVRESHDRDGAIYDSLKGQVDSHETVLERKGIDQTVVGNYSRWFFASNYENPIYMSSQDRRLVMDAIEQGTERKPLSFMSACREAIEQPWFGAALAVYQTRVDITDFRPFGEPPSSAAKTRVYALSENVALRRMRELVENPHRVLNLIPAYIMEYYTELNARHRDFRACMDKWNLQSMQARIGTRNSQRYYRLPVGGRTPTMEEMTELFLYARSDNSCARADHIEDMLHRYYLGYEYRMEQQRFSSETKPVRLIRSSGSGETVPAIPEGSLDPDGLRGVFK